MSARNMRAAAHAPCSQRALSMFTAQILNSRLVSRCSRIGGAHRVTCNSMVAPLAVAGGWGAELKHDVTCLCSVHWSLQSVVTLRSLHNQKTRHSCHGHYSFLSVDINDRWLKLFHTYGVLWLQRGNDYHGTPTAFLTNFTKTVKLTKTPIACHFWRWNSLWLLHKIVKITQIDILEEAC